MTDTTETKDETTTADATSTSDTSERASANATRDERAAGDEQTRTERGRSSRDTARNGEATKSAAEQRDERRDAGRDAGQRATADTDGGRTRTERAERTDRGERQDRYARERIRSDDGKYESREEYERRINELNEENAHRRRENKELKGSVDLMQRRAIMGDARIAFRDAGAVSDRVVDLFLADEGEHVRIDQKSGATTGLERVENWKTRHPEFFKPATTTTTSTTAGAETRETAGTDAGTDDKGAAGKGDTTTTAGASETKNGAANGANGTADKRGNRTAAGTSQGSGSGAGDSTDGLPDLAALKTPAERKKAIEDYKRGLRGSSGGFARASSKR